MIDVDKLVNDLGVTDYYYHSLTMYTAENAKSVPSNPTTLPKGRCKGVGSHVTGTVVAELLHEGMLKRCHEIMDEKIAELGGIIDEGETGKAFNGNIPGTLWHVTVVNVGEVKYVFAIKETVMEELISSVLFGDLPIYGKTGVCLDYSFNVK